MLQRKTRAPQLKNIKMLEETQNKYVGERRGSLKKTYYMIWKINLDDMKVENVLKASVSSRWDYFNQDVTYIDSSENLVAGEQQVSHVWAEYFKGLLKSGRRGSSEYCIFWY
jgi:hypothetical protein